MDKRVENFGKAYQYIIDNQKQLSNWEVQTKLRAMFDQLKPNQKIKIIEDLKEDQSDVLNISELQLRDLFSDMYNLGKNFPENISQSEIIETASVHLKKFDKATIAAYQLLNGLENDGILGYVTYKHMKGIYSEVGVVATKGLETEESLEKLKKRKPTSKKSAEKVSDSLYGGNLEKIGVSEIEAKKLAKKVLPGGVISTEIITDFQKTHNIDADGTIGRQTYMEMFTLDAISELEKEVKAGKELSKNIKNKILFIFENPYGSIETITHLSLILSKSEVKKLYENDVDFENKIELATKKGKEKIENGFTTGKTAASKNVKTLYQKIKEGDMEAVIKDPRGWLILGGLYIFGFLGDKGSSLFSRLGKLVGGIFVFNLVGGKEALSDLASNFSKENIEKAGKNISKVSKEIVEKFGKGYDSAKTKSANIFKDGFNLGTMWEGVKSFFSNSFDTVSLGINNYNESLKSIDNGKDYIETEKLNGLRDVFLSDEKFLNTRKADINSDYNNLLSQSAKDKLTKLYPNNSQEKEKNIKSFINKHLLEHSMEGLGENDLVRSMFMTSEITQKLDETLTQNVEYSENSKLQEKIQGQLAVFLQDSSDYSKNMKNAGRNIIKAIKNGTIEKFDLNTYGVDKNKEAPGVLKEIQKLVGYNKKFLETRKKIQAEIQDLEKFKYVENGDTKKTIVDKYNNLVAVAKKFNTTYNNVAVGVILNKNDFPVSEYETAVYAIKVELLEKLPAATPIGTTTAGNITAGTILTQLNAEKLKIESQRQIDGLPEVPKVPKITDSEVVFQKYLDDNLETFTAAKDLDPSNAKVKGVMDKFDEFVKRLRAKIDARGSEIESINKEILGLKPNTETSKEQIRAILQKLQAKEQDFLKLNKEVRGQNNLLPNWIYNPLESGDSQNLYIGLSDTINSIESNHGIDGENFETNLHILKDNFTKIRSNIFDRLKIDVDFRNQDITKGAEIRTKLGQIIALKEFVKDADVSKVLSGEKIRKLNETIQLLLKQYIKAIDSADLTGIKAIKKSYEENVYEFLKGETVVSQAWLAIFGDLDAGRGNIDKALRKRVEAIVNNKKVPDDIWKEFGDFVGDTKNIPSKFNTSIVTLGKTIGNGDNINNFISGLEGFIKTIPEDFKKEESTMKIIKKFNKILEKIEEYKKTEIQKFNI